MSAPKKAHDEMVSRSKYRIESIFRVVEARKEAELTSNLPHNLNMGEERVDLLLNISYNEKIYNLPVEIETQEGNMFQIEKNIGKCVETFGGVLVVPKSSMIPSIKKMLKEIPIKYSKHTMVISYALMQNKNNTSDRIIKEAIAQLLPALSYA
jgi:hypothetical protein